MKSAPITRRAVVLSALFVSGKSFFRRTTVAAQDASPISLLPARKAPFDGMLTGAIDLASALALLDVLPSEIGGRAKSRADDESRFVVAYGTIDPATGPEMAISALDLADDDFFPPGFTVERVILAVKDSSDYGATGLGRDGKIAWVQAESTVTEIGSNPATPEVIRPLFTLAWGIANSSWLFTAQTTTAADLESLVRAFMSTSVLTPATPAAISD